MSKSSLSAFVVEREKMNPEIRVHSSACSYVIRETRKNGAAVIASAESQIGIRKVIRAKGIRFSGMHFMPCCGVPEGFWIETPKGDPLKLSATRQGARSGTRRIHRLAKAEIDSALNGLSAYAREILDTHVTV
jgi:hypothetical protein